MLLQLKRVIYEINFSNVGKTYIKLKKHKKNPKIRIQSFWVFFTNLAPISPPAIPRERTLTLVGSRRPPTCLA